ncbi:MAG: F-box protein [Verrucomicrobia bacterium]|nr:F-box protein [Verrucomicrobiota bacterium]MBS0647270.1 F-box protein [Verrucomicrobiota bacterium]
MLTSLLQSSPLSSHEHPQSMLVAGDSGTFTCLPDELVAHIFCLLQSLGDQLRFISVCKRFKNIVFGHSKCLKFLLSTYAVVSMRSVRNTAQAITNSFEKTIIYHEIAKIEAGVHQNIAARRSLRLAKQAFDSIIDAESSVVIVKMLMEFAHTSLNIADQNGAEELLTEASTIAAEQLDASLKAYCFLHIGKTDICSHDIAGLFLNRARLAAMGIQDDLACLKCLLEILEVCLKKEALDLVEAVLNDMQQVPTQSRGREYYYDSQVLSVFACAYARVGRELESDVYFSRSWSQAVKIENSQDKAHAFFLLAQAYKSVGKVTKARCVLRGANQLVLRIRHRDERERLQALIFEAECESNSFKGACRTLSGMEEGAEKQHSLTTLAKAYTRVGKTWQARQIIDVISDPYQALQAMIVLAHRQHAIGQDSNRLLTEISTQLSALRRIRPRDYVILLLDAIKTLQEFGRLQELMDFFVSVMRCTQSMPSDATKAHSEIAVLQILMLSKRC